MKFITRLIHRIPKYYKNVWYNQSVYIKERKYPIIFDEDERYINCFVGRTVAMGKTKDGRDVNYKVISLWRTSGGDWLSDSDAINCDLQFSYISPKNKK
jgi:hypothetical protein